ncbi:glycoside hydrolase family 79 protein [Macroventuria anomochaeta]|uniref:Glycoside hydrolase family 79 protein n=1 Tax=Macroventuria anomochaeta TaxID=301207 RepID=A0ACB6S279_9PLEO|nr:glycoside hydrolase family 79 protein [Macroventuria anomochaeta]KAF2628256.1 glycoside hydrolase family 79 protein [Macroventuria anomochaeta]
MLQNLKDISGSAVPVRVGGTTANHAIWTPNQKEAIIQNFATPGADQPANVTWGPAYLESFKVFPKGTKYTIGVTFDSGKKGEDASVAEATAFYKGMDKDLYAIEVGNEFDVFPVNRNTTTWTISQYVSEWLSRTSAIASRVLPKNNQRFFQAGIFVTPGTISADVSWTAQAAIDLGIASTGLAKTFCTHQYFGAACRPVKPTLAGNVMNRTALIQGMNYHAGAAAYSVSKGLQYVIGETNSIACQGLAGASDVFGAAVWSVDYALYAASLNVSNMYWHMGTGYRYSAWQATQNGTTTPGPRPLYYGNWLTATALGDSDAQVVSIVNTTSLAGYAIYSSKLHRSKLKSVVLVNMEVFNSTSTPATQRPSVSFALPAKLGGKNCKASVRRLTAAGAEVRDEIAFAGRTVALDGTLSGRESKERVSNGVVNVRASEAVLVTFN